MRTIFKTRTILWQHLLNCFKFIKLLLLRKIVFKLNKIIYTVD